MLNYALKYLSYGLSVIPLAERSKTPLIKWQEFQSRRASEQELKDWWNRYPNANVGVVTGTISSIVIIDLDGLEGLESAKKLNLHTSVQSITGNGRHLWYRTALKEVGNYVRLAKGLDIRGEGGYVVAPPSIHENGRRYRWINQLNPKNLPIFPNILQNVLFADSKVSLIKEEGWNKQSEGWIAKALQEMKNGNIDNTLFSILCRMRSDGWDAVSAKLLLEPHADRVGAEDGHLDEKIKNVWERYESRTSSQYNLSTYENRNRREALIIHSPTNPNSLEQFELQRRLGQSGNETGIKTGYSKLDQMLQGGLKSSRLFTLAARTGVGKTNWVLGAVRNLCESGKRVLLFSTEMPYAQIWERYIAMLSDREQFSRHEFYVCDSFAPNLEKVEEAINEIKPDVFMFDHINHVSEEQRELGSFMQGLNYLRRKYDIAGIVTAQLNRSADWIDLKSGEKVTPRMSMIKGSGTIEQASSRVLLLSEVRVIPECIEIVGNLDKNDNGPKGLIHFGLFNNPYRIKEL